MAARRAEVSRARLRSLISRLMEDAPMMVPESSLNRRDAQLDGEQRSALVPANGLEVGDVLALADTGQNVALVIVQLGRDQLVNGGAHHLLRRISEDAFGRRIPAQHSPVECLAHDRVVRRLHNRG